MNEEKPWTKAKSFWETMEIGDTVLAMNLCNLIGVDWKTQGNSVSAFLSHMAKTGQAEKSRRDGYTVYRKVAREKPVTPNPVPVPADSFTPADLGESVLAVIEKLKRKMQELKTDLDEAIREKTEAQKMLEQAKDKILHLNNQLAERKGKGSFKLSELQNLYNGLPPQS